MNQIHNLCSKNSKTSQVFKLKIMNYNRLEESSSDFIYTVGERKKISKPWRKDWNVLSISIDIDTDTDIGRKIVL